MRDRVKPLINSLFFGYDQGEIIELYRQEIENLSVENKMDLLNNLERLTIDLKESLDA